MTLGEIERAKTWAEHALLMDPENNQLRFNLACAMAKGGQAYFALELLGSMVDHVGREALRWIRSDSDLKSLHGDPRFEAMMATAEARFAAPAPA